MDIKIKRLSLDAVIPTYASPGDAGLDLVATSRELVQGGNMKTDFIEYGTGIALEIPPGYVGLLFPRSSVVTTNNRLGNCVGVIDSDYRGEITFVFDNVNINGDLISDYDYWYRAKDRVGQLVILPFPKVELEEVEELSESERGVGGYGHTGR